MQASASDPAPGGPIGEPLPFEPASQAAEAAARCCEPRPNESDSFTADLPKAPPVAPELPAVDVATPAGFGEPRLNEGRTLWGFVLPSAFFLSVIVLVIYVAPYLLTHWRVAEAQAEAEASYVKRRAELKAEAEHADERLELLDKKVHLAALGFREVVRKVTPRVVNIQNLGEPKKADLLLGKRSMIYDLEKNRNFAQLGVGSGILVKPGYILTNHHVVRGALRLRITFASGQSLGIDPESVSADPITDLAVIRLPAKPPAHLKDDINLSTDFADSDKDVQVGDWALAIGSPLGLRQTVTQGVISAKGRLLGMLDLVELLQTDAPINPGNSGGPLFDQRGRVAGINVAIASDNGGNQGIGFAIPSNTAKKIFDQLVAQGEVPRGYLGIALEEIAGPRAKELGLGEQGGVLITQVIPDQAGEKAGLRTGDVILRFNNEALLQGQPVRHLRQLIVDTEPETQVSLEILRGGKKQNVPVKVGKRPVNLP